MIRLLLLLLLIGCAPAVDVPFEGDVRYVAVVTFFENRLTGVSKLHDEPFSLYVDDDHSYQLLGWREGSLIDDSVFGVELAVQTGCAPPLPIPDRVLFVDDTASPRALEPAEAPRITTRDRIERCRCEELIPDFNLAVTRVVLVNSTELWPMLTPASNTTVFLADGYRETNGFEVGVEGGRRLPAGRYFRASDGSLWVTKEQMVFRGTTVDDLAPVGIEYSSLSFFAGSPPWAPLDESGLYLVSGDVLEPLWGRTYSGLECARIGFDKHPFWRSPDDFVVLGGRACRFRNGVSEPFELPPLLWPYALHPELGLVGAGDHGALFMIDLDSFQTRPLLPPRSPIDRVEALGIWRDQLMVARMTGEISLVGTDGSERLLTRLDAIPTSIAPLENGFAIAAKNRPPAGYIETNTFVFFFMPVECL